MKIMIKLNLLRLFKIKRVILITLVFTLLAFLQLNFIFDSNDGLSTNLWDYLLFSFGGFMIHDPLFRLFSWISIYLPIIVLVYMICEFDTGYEIMILTRIRSRLIWFISKFFTLIITIILYQLWLFIIHIIIGSLFLKSEPIWGIFANKHLQSIIELSSNPKIIITFSSILLFTGLTAMCFIVFSGAIIFKNSINYYAVILMFSIGSSFFYINDVVGRKFSPFNYGSFLDLSIVAGGNWTILLMYPLLNIGLSFVLFFLGFILVRNRNLQNNKTVIH